MAVRDSDSHVIVQKASDSNRFDDRPFVVVLGWAGGQPDHVAKYAKLYNKLGYDTVTFTAECHRPALPDVHVAEPLTRFLFNPSVAQEYQTRPFVVHSLSMNGVRALLSIRRGLVNSLGEERATQVWLGRTKGIVFDSAPARIEAHADTKAYMLSTDSIKGIPDSWRKTFVYGQFAARLLVTDAFPALQKCLRLVDVFDHEVPLPSRQLFFYSISDVMVPHDGVEEFIDKQKARGYNVTAHRFTDSAHVAHLRTHPREYELAVKTFLDDLEKLPSKI